MPEPVIFDRKPVVLELEPGQYFWCACGRSKNQPFCDGSHAGTGFSPAPLVLETGKKVAVCNCKHTRNPPFCDGTHAKLP